MEGKTREVHTSSSLFSAFSEWAPLSRLSRRKECELKLNRGDDPSAQTPQKISEIITIYKRVRRSRLRRAKSTEKCDKMLLFYTSIYSELPSVLETLKKQQVEHSALLSKLLQASTSKKQKTLQREPCKNLDKAVKYYFQQLKDLSQMETGSKLNKEILIHTYREFAAPYEALKADSFSTFISQTFSTKSVAASICLQAYSLKLFNEFADPNGEMNFSKFQAAMVRISMHYFDLKYDADHQTQFYGLLPAKKLSLFIETVLSKLRRPMVQSPLPSPRFSNRVTLSCSNSRRMHRVKLLKIH